MRDVYVKHNKERGVTIIELIVVLAVFTIIVGVTASIFVSVSKQYRRVLTEQEVLNQSNYALEYMARSLRDAVKDSTGSCLGASFIGQDYLLTHLNGGFYEGVKFIDSSSVCHEFYRDVDGILKEVKGAQPAQNILSDKFTMVYSRFVLNGNKTLQSASLVNTVQPRLTVAIKIQFSVSGIQQERIIQTTVSENTLNAQ